MQPLIAGHDRKDCEAKQTYMAPTGSAISGTKIFDAAIRSAAAASAN